MEIPKIVSEGQAFQLLGKCGGGRGCLYKHLKKDLIDTELLYPAVGEQTMRDIFENEKKLKSFTETPRGNALLLGLENCLVSALVDMQPIMEKRHKTACERANAMTNKVTSIQSLIKIYGTQTQS